MTKKLFRQVHKSPEGFFFRLTLPVAHFECEERYETAEDSALRCDLFKLYLVRTFKLTGNTMFPSLPPERFSALLAEAGIDRTSSQSLLDALPQSCRDFLLDGGHDELTKNRAGFQDMNRVIS